MMSDLQDFIISGRQVWFLMMFLGIWILSRMDEYVESEWIDITWDNKETRMEYAKNWREYDDIAGERRRHNECNLEGLCR